MKKPSKTCVKIGILGAASLALSACVSLTIDEKTAFAPPKRSDGPATTQVDLNSRWRAGLTGLETAGEFKVENQNDGGLKLTALKPRRNRTEMALPMIVRHGFISEGPTRIAYSLFRTTDQSAGSQNRPLVVHCAGNAGDRYNSGLAYAAKAMPWADVLVFDYPGYGDTPGPASAERFEASALALGARLTELGATRKLVFWGHSLGGFVCSRLASTTEEADGLILEATAPNAQAVAKAWTPGYARLFVRTTIVPSLASYDVVNASSQIKGPILVLGAAKDSVLPVVLARQIGDGLKARGANVTYAEFSQGEHWNVPSQAQFPDTLNRFFQSIELHK